MTDADHDMDIRCWSCYRVVPQGRVHAVCGECGHTWRTRWHLIWHEHKVLHSLDWPFWRSFRRPKRISVCPCCVHDL
jgi:hypothetical protein